MAAKKPLPDRVQLKGLDSLFGIDQEQTGQVLDVPIRELFPFQNHPFKVLDDEKMAQTVESVRENGILVPIMVRNRPEGGYEVISGHRRKHAAEIVGLETVPVTTMDNYFTQLVHHDMHTEEWYEMSQKMARQREAERNAQIQELEERQIGQSSSAEEIMRRAANE